LASVKLGSYVPFDYVKYFPVRLFPAHSVIIVFSSVIARDIEVYSRLRSFGYDVLLISPDPVDLASKRKKPNKVNHLATRIARVERVILLNKMVGEGVKVIDWQLEDPLDQVIHGFLEKSMRWRK